MRFMIVATLFLGLKHSHQTITFILLIKVIPIILDFQEIRKFIFMFCLLLIKKSINITDLPIVFGICLAIWEVYMDSLKLLDILPSAFFTKREFYTSVLSELYHIENEHKQNKNEENNNELQGNSVKKRTENKKICRGIFYVLSFLFLLNVNFEFSYTH